MDLDNVQIGLDPQSKTGLDPKGKWTPTIEAPLPQINEEVKANATVLVNKLNENLKNAKFNGELKGVYKEKLDDLIKRFDNDEVTVGAAITEIGLMNKFGSEFFYTCCMKYFIEHIPATTDELQKMAYQGLLYKKSDLLNINREKLPIIDRVMKFIKDSETSESKKLSNSLSNIDSVIKESLPKFLGDSITFGDLVHELKSSSNGIESVFIEGLIRVLSSINIEAPDNCDPSDFNLTFTELKSKYGKIDPKINCEESTLIKSEEPKELGLTSDYPKGVIIHPMTIPGLKVFDMSEPDPKYPIEDFELSVTRIYDDGRQEEVQNMILGWRGSIKGYVKVYEDDTFENYLYGFKQVIRNRKGRKPSINVRIKYHNKLGGLITPVFGKNGDEKISKSDLNFRLC